MLARILGFVWLLCVTCTAKVHEFHWELGWKLDNPDGMKERRVIAINNETPLPTVRVKRNDRVIVHVKNNLGTQNTSIHFHGLFQNGTNNMDGPEFVTQCPIPPGYSYVYNFTVPDQEGTFWYHSHSGPQYGDGLRGLFIIEPEDAHFKFDEEVTLSVTDWYHDEAKTIMKSFLNRYNPTGAEPIPQNSLFNYTRNATWNVQPKKTYFLHIANIGMFVSQYLYIENHNFTIVEVDGVYVKPQVTDSIYIGVGQRYGVLVETGDFNENFRFLNVMDEVMLDVLPPELQIISTNWMVYNEEKPNPSALENKPGSFDKFVDSIDPFDDFNLVPYESDPLMEDAGYTINLNFEMSNLGNGVVYALFNGKSYVAPKVPTLMTALSAGKYAHLESIYGSNTNTYTIVEENQVVDIVLNNMDAGKHPFHLHGHTFQVLARSPEGTDEEPYLFDPKNHTEFPSNPVVRDTVVVNANGYIVIRFRADNPGVWFFHCHVDWHLEQGLAIVLVELPSKIQQAIALPQAQLDICKVYDIPTEGNAAGRSGSKSEWFNFKGENVQCPPLPAGFTRKGYVAFIACTLLALWGLLSIYKYGMEDVALDDGEDMIHKLEQILQENGALSLEDTRPLTGDVSN